ncbi:transcriptional regulator [Candidatus Epulonipiscium viviparus]|uniref:transcriptional regulator n=1 Tax=Candidatus Epulonipiscium viviparus TaxID=420336 RepID=UPI00016BFEF7|nr:transcriptional regulator [Candidatus Epulopiscium viviparus]
MIHKEYNHTALVNIINTPQEYDLIEDYFTSRIIAGGIFIGFPYQLQILQELAQKYNIVLIDQITLTEDTHNKIKVVNTDNILGGYIATKHLISYGHTNILHVAGDDRLSSIERKQGYIKAMLEHNLNTQVIAGLYREDIAYAVTTYGFTQLVWDGGIHYLHISAILFVVSFTLMKHSTINLI